MKNFREFFALLRQLPDGYDMKDSFVTDFTEGRTASLHEMTEKEYAMMCKSMRDSLPKNDNSYSFLRKKRSCVLHLMQQIGIDTSRWDEIDRFCLSSKVAGKTFRELSIKDLEEMSLRLRQIDRKGGLKKKKEEVIYIPVATSGRQLLN